MFRLRCAVFYGSVIWAAAATATPLQLDPARLEAAIGWDDNLTHAAESPSRLGDRVAAVSLSRRASSPVTPNTRAVFDASLLAEKLGRYEDLDRLTGGLSGELQYRTSAAFFAPTFALVADLQRDQYRSRQRTGTRVSVAANARQSWTDRIDAFAEVSWSRRDANDAVFDANQRALRGRVDYAAGKIGNFYGGAEFRRGDVQSTTMGSEPEYANAARAEAADVAFGPGYYAFRFFGRTQLWTLGWNLPLGAAHALDLSWRQAQSVVHIPTETVRYRSNLVSLDYLRQF
jgi:hypothetical protein